MSEELQNLLDRIQKDGVDKAEKTSAEIVAQAERKAGEILDRAKAEAKAMREAAERDAESFAERGRKSVEQAGRDVVLSVRDAVDAAFRNLASAEVAEALDNEVLKKMLLTAVEAYCKSSDGNAALEVLVPEKQRKDVTDYLVSRFGDAMKKGVEVKSPGDLLSGFRVAMVKENVEHDFSEEAITEAICRLLRPRLAEILNPSTDKTSPQNKTSASDGD